MNYFQDSQAQRKEADLTIVAGANTSAQGQSDPEWGRKCEEMYGKGANAFKVFGEQYMDDRKIGYTTTGDGLTDSGYIRHDSTNAFESHDGEAGQVVRKTIPGA
ncbi:hypothetical protein [Nocardia sp. NBC_00403]|uniref:hypothetical protein n=1 Tax=Nocardia sp. NBC_00403 TaxID=2975990 RepID=UPI002E1F16D6